jgi:long-chain fatty acid transport protein
MNTVNRSLPQTRAAALVRRASLFALVLILSPLWAHGEGFRNPPPGTFNLGRSGGRIAQIDDASAVQQNPANLLDLGQAQLDFTPTIIYIHADFTSASGASSDTKDPWKFLPNFFASVPVMEDRVVLGLGLTTPYGLASKWNQTGAFADPLSLKYQAPYSTELTTINVNPTIAVRLLDNLTLGAGLDVTWSQLTFHQLYPWLAFPGSTGAEPDGNIKAQGDGFGYGGNLGLTWQVAEKHRLAVTYRSPIQVNYEGESQINNITPTAAFLGATPHSKFETEIKFPTIVALGYGVQVTDTLRLEVDGEWLQFSNFKSLNLDVGNNALLFPTTHYAQNWKNTYTMGIGGDWRFAPDWVVRFGYQHYETPVPDSTLSTTIPDANQNVFTVGLGYQYGHHAFEGAYGFDIYANRTINGNVNSPAFNGTYQEQVHLFSLSYRYSF